MVLAGGNFGQFESALEFAAVKTHSSRTLSRSLESVVVATDEVFHRELQAHRSAIKAEPGRGRIKIPKVKHFFANNWERLKDILGSTASGVQVLVMSLERIPTG